MLNLVLLSALETIPFDGPLVYEASGIVTGIVGLVIGVVSASISVGMSVDAANKQEAAKKNAEKAAEEALESARETIRQKKLAHLAINQVAENTAAENAAVVSATGIQVARGGDPRQLAATIGRTQMASNVSQEEIQGRRAKSLYDLELLKAEEDQTIQSNLAEIDKMEAEGAQAAASDAAKLQAQYETQAISSGVAGGANVASSAVAVGGAVQDANTGAARVAAEGTITDGYTSDATDGTGTSSIGIPALTSKYGGFVPEGNQAEFNAEAASATTYDSWLAVYSKYGGKIRDIR